MTAAPYAELCPRAGFLLAGTDFNHQSLRFSNCGRPPMNYQCRLSHCPVEGTTALLQDQKTYLAFVKATSNRKMISVAGSLSKAGYIPM